MRVLPTQPGTLGPAPTVPAATTPSSEARAPSLAGRRSSMRPDGRVRWHRSLVVGRCRTRACSNSRAVDAVWAPSATATRLFLWRLARISWRPRRASDAVERRLVKRARRRAAAADRAVRGGLVVTEANARQRLVCGFPSCNGGALSAGIALRGPRRRGCVAGRPRRDQLRLDRRFVSVYRRAWALRLAPCGRKRCHAWALLRTSASARRVYALFVATQNGGEGLA
jgi:hypothetical protein